jgi:hypothetical protein
MGEKGYEVTRKGTEKTGERQERERLDRKGKGAKRKEKTGNDETGKGRK